VLLAVGSPGVVFAAMAGIAAAAALLVAPLHSPRALAGSADRGGIALLAREPDAVALVALVGAQFVAIGALDVLYVVLAIGVLGIGGSGAGYLNAAFGAGGVAAIAATAALVGRRRLVPALGAGIALWSAAFVVVALAPSVAAALLLLAAAGAGRAVVDVAGRTLLQRAAPPHVLARVFGVLEGLSMAGLAVGSLLAPALVAAAGPRGAFACLAAVLPLVVLVVGRRLAGMDARATVPVVEIALLRSLPIFAPLPAPELETLARALEPVELAAGTAVVREGEPGDRYHVIADGELEVSTGTRLGRGEGFGSIALLRNVPRTATVTARTPVRLYALAGETFVAVVARHPASAHAAERGVREQLEATLPA
jgi:MFS family permease